MSFLNIALAFGSLAFAVPLVIHLLTRSRFQQVNWGAMHLLDQAVSINSRRMRFEQFLLLLLRCLIPVILALCLARPVLTGAHSLIGSSPRSLVILLDDSFSMSQKSGDKTAFDRARAAAQEFIGNLPQGSEAFVLTTGGRPTALTDEPTSDLPRLSKRLEALTASSGACQMQVAVDAGLTALAKMNHAQRQLLVISDFQKSEWDGVEASFFENVRQQLDSLPIKPQLLMLPVTSPTANISGEGEMASENVAVESLELSRRWLGVGQSLDVKINLRNFGNESVTAAPLRILVDGQLNSETKASIAANSIAQSEFVWAFEEPGSHTIEVELGTKDGVQADNQRAVQVTVMPQIPVLLVDGDRRGEALQSETDYLAIALAPFAFGNLEMADAFRTNLISPNELQLDRLRENAAVVLANVPQLNQEQVQWLKQFLDLGGCVMVFPGDRIQKDWYNKTLANSDPNKPESGWLPASFGEVLGDPKTTDKATKIAAQRFEHPAFVMFNDTRDSELQGAQVKAWYELKLPEDHPGTQVVATLEANKQPLVLERRVGKGVVWQWAIPCDTAWSDLPIQPVYLPLMQQLIAQSVSVSDVARNLNAGDELRFTITDPVRPLAPKKVTVIQQPDKRDEGSPATKEIVLSTAGGFEQKLDVQSTDQNSYVAYAQTQRPGVYTLQHGQDRVHFVLLARHANPLCNRWMK